MAKLDNNILRNYLDNPQSIRGLPKDVVRCRHPMNHHYKNPKIPLL